MEDVPNDNKPQRPRQEYARTRPGGMRGWRELKKDQQAALRRKGGKKGGRLSWANLTPAERKAKIEKARLARWGPKRPVKSKKGKQDQAA